MTDFSVPPGLRPGDPLWTQALGGARDAFDAATGRPIVIVVDAHASEPALAALAACRRASDAGEAHVFAALGGAAAGGALAARYAFVRFLLEDHLPHALSGGGDGLWLVLDPMLRVFARGALDDREDLLRRLGDLARARPAAGAGAPVLVLPRAFEPDLCRALIEAFDREGGVSTGFMHTEGKRSVERLDAGWKIRRDVMLSDPSLVAAVRARIGRRVCPEIRKAFQFVATRTERDLVACYDAGTGGHFAPHRDDTGPLVAHRRFALSIPLNDDFEGGGLAFPEFAAVGLTPTAGSAVVFSGSLLHRVEPVTRGSRYAFLTFLHDEAAEKIRLANLATAGAGARRSGPFSQPRAASGHGAPGSD